MKKIIKGTIKCGTLVVAIGCLLLNMYVIIKYGIKNYKIVINKAYKEVSAYFALLDS